MTFLLDVNVLIALIDDRHVFHVPAHRWFEADGHGGWATCPISENGLIRIMGGRRYPNGPGTPGPVLEMLRSIRRQPGHQFWPDEISLTGPEIHASLIAGCEAITDTYLLALAASRGGRLATFDRKMRTDAVAGGKAALCVIPA